MGVLTVIVLCCLMVINPGQGELETLTTTDDPNPQNSENSVKGFKVSLDPPGGNLSQVFIPQYGNYPPNLDLDGLPYGETVFEDMEPGKQYNIRVELVAQEEISKPILSIQLTSPQSGDGTLKILYNDNSSNETHHTLWLAVMGAWDISDGERYDSFEIVSKLSQPSDSEEKGEHNVAVFDEDTLHGETTVDVETVSGEEFDWPGTIYVKYDCHIICGLKQYFWDPDFKTQEITEENPSDKSTVERCGNEGEPSNKSTEGEPKEPKEAFTVSYRDETSFKIEMFPPKNIESFKGYKATINPPDADKSEVLLRKEETSSKPSFAVFENLYPGRMYNVSFQYVYEKGVSKPIFKTYRTVPQPPLDVTLTDFSDIELTSFSSPITAHWASPEKDSELDGYQVIWPGQNLTQFIGIDPVTAPTAQVNVDLYEGENYTVIVRTVSGSVFSAPVEANLTIAPLPPSEFTFGDNFRYTDNNTKYDWDPTPNSEQYQFKAKYYEYHDPKCNESADWFIDGLGSKKWFTLTDNNKISELVVKTPPIDLTELEPARPECGCLGTSLHVSSFIDDEELFLISRSEYLNFNKDPCKEE